MSNYRSGGKIHSKRTGKTTVKASPTKRTGTVAPKKTKSGFVERAAKAVAETSKKRAATAKSGEGSSQQTSGIQQTADAISSIIETRAARKTASSAAASKPAAGSYSPTKKGVA